MGKNYTISEFLKLLSTYSDDEAIDLIGAFQCGMITVENIAVEDIES
jgi:hypothetical protein